MFLLFLPSLNLRSIAVPTFIMPELQKSVQYVLDQALHGNETSNYELEFLSSSDEIRYLLVNATSRRDAENNIVGVVGVVRPR